MTDGPPIRIGTAEREAAYAALNTHLDAGRLDVEEYAERFAKASVARTRDDLDVLFLDLPQPHAFTPPPPPKPSWFEYASTRFAGAGSMVVKLAIAAALIAAVVLSDGAAFVLLPAIGLFLGGRRHYRRGGYSGPHGHHPRGPGRPGAW